MRIFSYLKKKTNQQTIKTFLVFLGNSCKGRDLTSLTSKFWQNHHFSELKKEDMLNAQVRYAGTLWSQTWSFYILLSWREAGWCQFRNHRREGPHTSSQELSFPNFSTVIQLSNCMRDDSTVWTFYKTPDTQTMTLAGLPSIYLTPFAIMLQIASC